MKLKLKQKLWLAAGGISLVLGLVGAFLPVAPTTPFILLAAFCFTRGSQKALHWLENHKFFGQILRDYRAGLGVPLSTKVISISTLWLGMFISMSIVQKLWITVCLICCGIAVTIHICHLKTRDSMHSVLTTDNKKNKFLTKSPNLLKRPAARCDGRTD